MVQLSHQDIAFMLAVLDLPIPIRRKLEALSENFIKASLPDNDANELRDLCADRLITHGFNEDYSPNEEGLRLEALIDKLYDGQS